MKTLQLIILAVGIGVAPQAFAKNKENCRAIGGKWMPGSNTNVEVGACFFTIRAPSKDLSGAFVGAISAEDCNTRGGKLTNAGGQCSVAFGSAIKHPINPTNPSPSTLSRPCPAYVGDPCDGVKGQIGDGIVRPTPIGNGSSSAKK